MNEKNPLRKKTLEKDKIKKTYETYQFTPNNGNGANQFDLSMTTKRIPTASNNQSDFSISEGSW